MILDTYIPFVTTLPDEDGEYIATCIEFPGVYSFGTTPKEAIEELKLLVETLVLNKLDKAPSPIFIN